MHGITHMQAQHLHAQASIDDAPLHLEEVPIPSPGSAEILVEVEACALCRTDLHVVEGDLPAANDDLPRLNHDGITGAGVLV